MLERRAPTPARCDGFVGREHDEKEAHASAGATPARESKFLEALPSEVSAFVRDRSEASLEPSLRSRRPSLPTAWLSPPADAGRPVG
jgi:hypothetical protein